MPGVERVELNPAGLREYLLTEPALPRVLEPHAVAVEARAVALAAQHVDTGDYERGIRHEPHRNPGRQGIRVIAEDEKSAILEDRYRILGRAAG